jgi:hypothetical protein
MASFLQQPDWESCCCSFATGHASSREAMAWPFPCIGFLPTASALRVSAAAMAASAIRTHPPALSHVIAFIRTDPRKDTGPRMEIHGDPDWRRAPHVARAGQSERIDENEAGPRTTLQPYATESHFEPLYSSSILVNEYAEAADVTPRILPKPLHRIGSRIDRVHREFALLSEQRVYETIIR